MLPTRPITTDELRTFFGVLEAAFGEDASDDGLEIESLTAEPERTLATFDGDDIVATAGAFTFELAVPGGRLPAAGVTYVSVRPTHRRRGLLTELMRRQLHDVHERGEPLAVLWASEAAIYGRFGYGLASQLLRVEIDRVDARIRGDLVDTTKVELRQVSPSEAVDDLIRVEHAVLDERPGQFVRDRRWIEQLVADPPSRRNGMSSKQCVLARVDGDVVGYALYHLKSEPLRPHMLPNGEVLVMAQRAATPQAYLALTRLLLSIDLMRRVRWWNQPVDTTLPHLLTDSRQARTTVLDALHLRIVDVETALQGRRYAAPVDVVLEIDDALCPWNAGRWRLTADASGASCERTDRPAQLHLPVEALGALYLGGTSLTALAAAGRVEAADPEPVRAVSLAFGWHLAPWCPVVF